MIGKWLEQLTEEPLDRILTMKMHPGSYTEKETEKIAKDRGIVVVVGPCLIGVATGFAAMTDRERNNLRNQTFSFFEFVDAVLSCPGYMEIEACFDCLCARFGTTRINTLIRNRVLQIKATRILKTVTTTTLQGVST